MIHARGLSVRFGSRVALDDVDLDVAAGEIVGILGPNGAGKTSLLRLLCRMPHRIGIAPDDSIHADPLTGRENAYLFARLAGLSDAQTRRRAGALLDRLLPGGDADRPVSEYSQGMRRRLVLVQALAHDPELIVLDEPGLGLDLDGREQLRLLLRERAAAGAAIVMASNDVGDAERVCDRVVFLRAGKKVLEGSPADLIRQLAGSTRFTLQLKGGERLVRHSPNGPGALPQLCSEVLATGALIETVDVRSPDLGDVYLRATGEELAA